MKSLRKLKDKETIASTQSLANLPEANETESWLKPKTLVKPANQIQGLSEKELDEEHTRILNANNPKAPHNIARFNFKENQYKSTPCTDHVLVHYEHEGYMQLISEQENSTEISGNKSVAVKNQFNTNERATQTHNMASKNSTTSTEVTIKKEISRSVNQFIIYDAYAEDRQQKELKKNIKSKTNISTNANDNHSSNNNSDELFKTQSFAKSLKILERMINQNTFNDISLDYKYFNDDTPSNVLLPLYVFEFEANKKKQVTSLSNSKQYQDLYAISYSAHTLDKVGPGAVALFTLKNPSYPEFVYNTNTNVTTISFHFKHMHLLAVGFQDGSIHVYDVQQKNKQPICAAPHVHADTVWQLIWLNDDVEQNPTLVSIASDQVMIHTILSNAISNNTIFTLYDPEDAESSLTATCIDCYKHDPKYFVIGTEEGLLVKCSKSYNNQYQKVYKGHAMSVYSVRINPCTPQVFISTGADFTVKVWDAEVETPILSFDLNSPVSDCAWSDYSSTVFAVVTNDGRVCVFDLDVNKFGPVCEQTVVKNCRLTRISFSKEYVLLAGDDEGCVHSMKLSAGLRRGAGKEESGKKIEKVVLMSSGRSGEVER